MLAPEGLPGRPWFRHTIFAPGEYTGYAAVVIPGVNEAIDAHDTGRAQAQMANVTAALVRATETLEEAECSRAEKVAQTCPRMVRRRDLGYARDAKAEGLQFS